MHLPITLPRPATAAPASASPSRACTVAIVIPNRDQPELLRRCVHFIESLHGPAPELVIVDHESSDPATLALYSQLRGRHDARIVSVHGRFNFSRMINLGVAATQAEVVLLLNNDVEITDAGEAEMMIARALRPQTGVVGAHLLYPDGLVQHAGVILRPGPSLQHSVAAQHVLRGTGKHSDGYLHILRTTRNYQAVTGAIMATRRTVFDQAGGFDEVSLPVEYNDIDYCLRVRAAGLRVISLPTKGIIHRESSTRGLVTTPEVQGMRTAAMRLMVDRWPQAVNHDPFRNPHLDLGERPEGIFPWTKGDAA